MNKYKIFFILIFIALMPSSIMAQISCGDSSKPRVLITCDPELDDLNSLIRLLLFSTDFRVEGLVYASSQFHWKGDGKGTQSYVPGREYSRNGDRKSVVPGKSVFACVYHGGRRLTKKTR